MSQTNTKTVVIVGASRSREKYGNKAVRAYLSQGYRVFPVNPHAKQIEGLTAYASLSEIPVGSVDLISVYLPPDRGVDLLEEMSRLQPEEVWFNPGSESPQLLETAERLGLPVIQACSILGVGRTPGEFESR